MTLDSYSISATQVSYDDFDTYTLATGKNKVHTVGHEAQYRAPSLPVGVMWKQANNYCLWLSEKTNKKYRLPTEAEWEYAARSRGKFYLFSTNDGTYRRGVNTPTYDDIRSSTPAYSLSSPTKIKSIPPNPLGIYQMGLNGLEWTNDWYDANYYSNSPELNPKGPSSGDKKAERGGGLGEGTAAMFTINRRSSLLDGKIVSPSGKVEDGTLVGHTFRCASTPN